MTRVVPDNVIGSHADQQSSEVNCWSLSGAYGGGEVVWVCGFFGRYFTALGAATRVRIAELYISNTGT